MNLRRGNVLACFLLLLGCESAFGQAVSQISGTAKDQSGAAVPGVAITVIQTDTGLKRATTTDDSGNYVLPDLPLGPYQLEATRAGFKTYVQTGIVLQVGAAPEIAVSMGIGQVTESVQVEGNAANVETRSIGVGSVMETQRILDLPLNGRQATDLIVLSGASVVTNPTPGVAMRTGPLVSVAGGHDYSVQYNLDGASHLQTYAGAGMPLPFPEALQEFKLVTSTQDVAGGGHSGASVNSVTKSGTNELHGDAFWFVRNAALNGRDFFAAKNDALKRNQFGGVIGGPLVRDRLFFFTGYQGTMVRQTPTATPSYVPTVQMLQGDFSAYLSNHCVAPSAFNAGVLDGANHLTQPLSPAALKIAAFLPKTSNPCGLIYTTNNPLHENDLQVPLRIDDQLTAKQSLFARYLITRNEQAVPHSIDPTNILNTQNVGADDQAQSLAVGDTYLLSSTLINSFRVFINRMGSNHPYAANFDPSQVGIQNFYTYLPGLMSMTVGGAGGGFSLGIPANFLHTTTGYTNFGVNEDITWVHGSHQISFGGNALRAILVGNNYAWSEGFMALIGVAGAPGFVSTGVGLADFVSGKIINLHQGNPNPNWTRQNFGGAYVSDIWKVAPKLTINAGLRWNPFIPIVFTQGDTMNFSLPSFYSGVRSTVIPNAPPGFSYPGDPGFNGKSGMNSAYNHFEPRLGLAWDPFGDGKTVIRLGAGTAYDFILQAIHMNSSSVNPFRETLIVGPVSLDNPYAGVPGGNPFPYTYNPKTPVFQYTPNYQGFYLIPPNVNTTQQYQWNLALQRQFTQSFFASATYMGTHLLHVWSAVDLNPAQYIPGNCVAGQYGLKTPGPCTQAGNVNQRRLLELNNPAAAANVLGDMVQLDSGGTQSYNALLLSATWRKSNLAISGNYTWSHCIGIPYTSVSNLGAAMQHGPYQNNGPVDRKSDMGDCVLGTLDMRHIANVTSVVGTGKGAGNDWTRRLTSNWNLSTIYTIHSGWATTPTISNDQAMNGLFSTGGGYQIPQRPNQVLADAATATKGQSCSPAPCVQWFNPKAFALPAPGTLGNIGFGVLRAPMFWEWDQAIIRQFRFAESRYVEFRAEAFNLTNSVRFYIPPNIGGAGADPTTTLGNPRFGNIYTSASTTGSSALTGSGGRVMQFALKFVF